MSQLDRHAINGHDGKHVVIVNLLVVARRAKSNAHEVSKKEGASRKPAPRGGYATGQYSTITIPAPAVGAVPVEIAVAMTAVSAVGVTVADVVNAEVVAMTPTVPVRALDKKLASLATVPTFSVLVEPALNAVVTTT
jgi:hypothetical protein